MVMNSSPSPYLNVARLQSTQRGMRRTSSCSTLTHSTGPIPSGKSKTSGSENGGVVCQSPSCQMTGGLRHSSIVVHIENDWAEISYAVFFFEKKKDTPHPPSPQSFRRC